MPLFFLSLLCIYSFCLNAVEVQKANVGDVKIAYYTRGNGQPLVMIAGFRSTMAKWEPALLEMLEKNYKLILFDNRGAGLSTDTDQDNTTIQQMADDTAGLIRALHLDSAYVLGWSMGARIASQLTIRHPELVKKLILCAPNAGGIHQIPTSPGVLKKLIEGQDLVELLFTHDKSGRDAAVAYQKSISESLAKGSIPDDFFVSQRTTERQNIARGKLWAQSNDNFNDLANIKIPVLVTDGREDIIDPPGNAKIVANQIPFCWSAFLEGGHAFLFQEASRFAELVRIFLE